MFDKTNDILNGWYNTINNKSLSEEKKEIAKNRASICESCVMKKTVLNTVNYCGACGCLFPAKFYSFTETNKCPLGKW